MVTRNGITKKTSLTDYANATREGGLIGINLEEGDALVGCVLTNGENEIILISHKGQAVRFNEDDLRDQGRDTVGVTGMRFKYDGDYVKAIEVCDPAARLLVAREDGIGKRTPFEDYRLTTRGGTGVIAIDLPEDGSVNVAGALSVRDTDEVMLLTAKGQSIRTRVNGNPRDRPRRQGRPLVTLADGDKLLGIARIVETDEEQVALLPAEHKRTAALNEIARLLDGHPDVANFAGLLRRAARPRPARHHLPRQRRRPAPRPHRAREKS